MDKTKMATSLISLGHLFEGELPCGHQTLCICHLCQKWSIWNFFEHVSRVERLLRVVILIELRLFVHLVWSVFFLEALVFMVWLFLLPADLHKLMLVQQLILHIEIRVRLWHLVNLFLLFMLLMHLLLIQLVSSHFFSASR